MEGSIFAVAWYRSEPTGQGIECRGLLMARANQYDQRRCSIRTVPDSEGAERNVDRICTDRDIAGSRVLTIRQQSGTVRTSTAPRDEPASAGAHAEGSPG